jgi:hypothetical protein
MLVTKLFKGLRERPLPEVGRYGVILARNALGLANPIRSADRETLEQVILPAYAARKDIRSVLFVGCEWYTKHYEAMLPGRTYLTIDPDPWKSRYGSRHHIVAGLEKLGSQVQPGTLDLILCNGVVGWGLDDREDCEQAFQACFDALRPSGELVIGWNDQPEHRPVDLASLQALARFTPVAFGPLGTTQYLANEANRHVFNFYMKPGPGDMPQ